MIRRDPLDIEKAPRRLAESPRGGEDVNEDANDVKNIIGLLAINRCFHRLLEFSFSKIALHEENWTEESVHLKIFLKAKVFDIITKMKNPNCRFFRACYLVH